MSWKLTSARGIGNVHCYWEILNERDEIILSTWPDAKEADWLCAAAAPQMLEALTAAVDHWDHTASEYEARTDRAPEEPPWLAPARAAIAAAKGAQP